MFSSNSPKLVRRLLDQYGAKSVELVAGDICTLSESALPSEIAVALIDVDLGDPVRCALDILYPKLMPGGAILIDDCPEKSSWVGARPAVVKWAAERGVVAEFDYGFGRIAVDQS
jgi:predicted O-methyltransferase YrrM